MRKLVDLVEIEKYLNETLQQINDCFCVFTPTAKRLSHDLVLYISNIELIKDISHTFKHELSLLQKNHPVPEHLNYNINASIFQLEMDLVYLSKFQNKSDVLLRWFSTYHSLNSFIIQNSEKPWNYLQDLLIQEEIVPNEPEAKVIKFSHLL